ARRADSGHRLDERRRWNLDEDLPLEFRLALTHRPRVDGRDLDADRGVGHTGHGAAQLERERRPTRRGEQEVLAALEPRVRVDGATAVGVELEMEVRMDSARVARVADVPDHLAAADLGAVLQPLGVRGSGDTLA